nr:MAG TPA: hypothetical protein [Caudoviricetes sp.]
MITLLISITDTFFSKVPFYSLTDMLLSLLLFRPL